MADNVLRQPGCSFSAGHVRWCGAHVLELETVDSMLFCGHGLGYADCLLQ